MDANLQVYRLSGPQALSFHDVARILGQHIKREIRYVDVPVEAVKQGMVDAGMDEWMATALAEILELFARGDHDTLTDEVQNITGHPPRSFDTFVQDHLGILDA